MTSSATEAKTIYIESVLELQHAPYAMKPTPIKMSEDGTLTIPVAAREALGLADGGDLILRIEDGVIMLEPLAQAIARVQAMVAPYATPGVLMSDELIADRRAEAAKEDEETRNWLTRHAMTDVDADRVVAHKDVVAWADNLSTDRLLPAPTSKQS